jgi:iron complex outermembrane recepter protein
VLRGPQGALYGRNAEGGAILITTRQPTNEFEGHVDAGGGSGGEFNTQGVASGPIVKDQLFFRVGVNYVDRSGATSEPTIGPLAKSLRSSPTIWISQL